MLLVTDLHFTDKEADRYRFKIFTWIHEYFMRTGDKNLLILGDLTDSKDHHSAALVNAIVKRMLDLQDAGMEIFILKGNHDYIDPANPYFEFLGRFEYINFIVDPTCTMIEGKRCLFLPHTRNPIEEWKADPVVRKYRKSAEYVFCHESVLGSVTSSGYEMQEGLLPSYFRRFDGEVFSGDIHCPQKIGPVIYVGTPYSIRFNDHYRGRAISIRGAATQPLFPDILGRWTLDIHSPRELSTFEAKPGDQLKVRYQLAERDEGHWDAIRAELYAVADKQNLEICSLQVVRAEKFPLRGKKHKVIDLPVDRPTDVVDRFSKQRGLPRRRYQAGRRLVEDN